MNKLFAAVIILISTFLIVTSCKKNDVTGTGDNTGSGTGSVNDTIVTNTKDTLFSNAVIIKFTDTSATVTNPFAGAGVTVTVSKADVTVTSTITSTEIYYVLSGNCSNGMFKLYSDYKFNLVFNGVGLTNTDGPAVNIQSSKKVTVLVLNNTNNRLIDGSTYASSTEDQKGAFFSEGQLNFTGYGTLTVKGKYKHAICSDGYIYVKEGNIIVSEAVSDAIHTNDYFKMDAGSINATSSGDGIDCEKGYININGGNVTVKSVDDGITASYEGTDATIIPYMLIKGGVINVSTTGEKGNALKSEKYTIINSSDAVTLTTSGRGAKGIKTGSNLTVTNGNITITNSGTAYYDATALDLVSPAGINCDSVFTYTEGILTITSSGSGGKGISVDGTSFFNGGTVNITTTGTSYTYNSSNSTDPKAIKSDGVLTVNGGTINIASADDGLKSDAGVIVNGGSITVSKSYEGIEAPNITLNNGNVNIAANNDGINCTMGTVSGGTEQNDGSLLTVAGGTIITSASSGDAVDCNGNAVMTGGTLVAQGPPSSPELALDYNGTFSISGGLLIASGPNSGNMIQGTSTSSAQYAMLVKMNSSVAAGTLINVQDASGNSLVTYAPARSAYYFILSSAALQNGASYKVYTGGSSTGTAAGGYYSSGTYSGGTLKGTVTISGKLTTVTL